MTKTPIEALQELNRLKRLKDAGLPYSNEEKRQAWEDAFEAQEQEELVFQERLRNPANAISPLSLKTAEETLKSLLAQDEEYREDLAVVRKIAEETVLKIRGSYDAPAFEVCVREEMASLLRAAANTARPTKDRR